MAIIALISVTTFCIFAMATLYIRNLKKPPFGIPYSFSYGAANSTRGPPADPACVCAPAQPSPFLPVWELVEGAGTASNRCASGPLTCDGFCCPAAFEYRLPESAVRPGDPYYAAHTGARPLGAAFDEGDGGAYRPPPTATSADSTDPLTRLDLGPLPVTLPDHNITVDGRYCWGRSCDTSRANYTFYVPVSRHFPPLPVELQFHAPDERYVRLCWGELRDRCPKWWRFDDDLLGVLSVEEMSAINTHSNAFELPMGKHTRAVFRFRVGYGPEMCGGQHDALVGAAFEQYTFIFYRVCDA